MGARKPDGFIESFSALSRALRLLGGEAYASLEIGVAQAKFLRHVALHGRISQAELARATLSDPALTGRALETLIERGWVRRKRCTEDRRQYLLELTAAGRRALVRVEQARTRFARRVETMLDAKDVADFQRVTGKIVAMVDEDD